MPYFEYRIHPSVGIARMGDSPDTYFVGRETPVDRFGPTLEQIPGKPDNRAGTKPFRDKNDKLAKQAARFRIFCYQYDTPPVSGAARDPHPVDVWEVTVDRYEVEWRVKVANRKSYDSSVRAAAGATPGGPDAHFDGVARLTNEPDEQKFDSTSADVGKLKTFTGKAGAHHADPRLDLGAGILEAGGQLLVLGSGGQAREIPGRSGVVSGLRWENWEDDAADGYVRATVKPKAGSPLPDGGVGAAEARQAWVVINMPGYGMDTPPAPSLYDLALSHAITHSGTRTGWAPHVYYTSPIDYHINIRPVLKAYVQFKYLSPEARLGMGGAGNGHGRPDDRFYDTAPAEDDPVRTVFPVMLRSPWQAKGHQPENYWSSPKYRPSPTTWNGTSGVVWVHDETAPEGATSRPGTTSIEDWGMPKLEFLAYPSLVYDWMKTWAGSSIPAAGDVLLAGSRILHWPWLLDRAHMGWMSGGSFYPGIEAGRDVHNPLRWTADWGVFGHHVDIRFGDPHENAAHAAVPGEMTQNLAVPWQSDFYFCTNKWWPASRPISVTQAPPNFYPWDHGVGGGLDLVGKWAKLGFVRYQSATGAFHEESRILPTP